MASFKRTYSNMEEILKIVKDDSSNDMDLGEFSADDNESETDWECEEEDIEFVVAPNLPLPDDFHNENTPPIPYFCQITQVSKIDIDEGDEEEIEENISKETDHNKINETLFPDQLFSSTRKNDIAERKSVKVWGGIRKNSKIN